MDVVKRLGMVETDKHDRWVEIVSDAFMSA